LLLDISFECVNERNKEQRLEEVLNMATRDTTGTVGNPTGSGLGASRTGSTSTPMGSTSTGSSTLGSSTTGGSSMDSVRDNVSGTVDQAKQQAEAEGNRLLGTARTRARSAFEHQQHRVADSIGSVAQALHQAADKLNEQNEDVVARYTDTAAQRIEQFADSLRSRNLDDLVGQAEQFARRQPEVFLGTAVATGFLIARFLRTSGNRASQRRSNLSYGGGTAGSYGERGYGGYGGQNRYSQQGGGGTGYGAGNRGYTGGTTTSTSPAGTSGVSGAGAASGSTLGGSAALASSTTGTATSATGAGASALERNTGVVGTSEKAEKSSTSLGSAAGGMSAIPTGGTTPSTVKPDDKGLGSTPPRGTNP
jgi:ElaB/YqjD/DUF883 family membrane-anchored ribosome-binding protein